MKQKVLKKGLFVFLFSALSANACYADNTSDDYDFQDKNEDTVEINQYNFSSEDIEYIEAMTKAKKDKQLAHNSINTAIDSASKAAIKKYEQRLGDVQKKAVDNAINDAIKKEMELRKRAIKDEVNMWKQDYIEKQKAKKDKK